MSWLCCRCNPIDPWSLYIVDHIGVRMTIVEAAEAFEIERHCERAVCAIKSDGTWSAVIESGLRPGREDVASIHHSLGGDDRFDDVGAVVAFLPIQIAVGECQRDEASFCAAVVD